MTVRETMFMISLTVSFSVISGTIIPKNSFYFYENAVKWYIVIYYYRCIIYFKGTNTMCLPYFNKLLFIYTPPEFQILKVTKGAGVITPTRGGFSKNIIWNEFNNNGGLQNERI